MPVLPGAQPWSSDGGDVGALVLHGFTGSPQGVRPWGEALAAGGLTVRVPRLPGHGTTWQELNTTRWADWYTAAETALVELRSRCSTVVVAGLSVGGALALALAELRGADVDAIALVNPAVRFDDPRLRALPVLKHLVPSLSGIGSDIAKEGAVELAYPRLPLKALHSVVGGIAEVARELPRVTQPLLVLHSPQDHVVPPSSSELVLSRVSSKDVTDVVLGRSYHVATLDHDASTIEHETLKLAQRVAG
ncbi:alpha/beta hydrolase [Angustibacter aerolatus]